MIWFMALALCVQATDKTTVTFGSTLELETIVRDGLEAAQQRFN